MGLKRYKFLYKFCAGLILILFIYLSIEMTKLGFHIICIGFRWMLIPVILIAFMYFLWCHIKFGRRK